MKPTKTNQKFKVGKDHVQGAVAMLLVIALLISALWIIPGVNLFGTSSEGYEYALEKSITISPHSIEAVRDYSGEAFTLTGLPEDELGNIKPEHIFLSGYLYGLTVQGVEVSETNLIVTVAAGDASENSDESEQSVHSGSNGFIAVLPDAFQDKSYYYQGETLVVYPRLVSEIEAIEKNGGLSVEQEITLTLENDSFIDTITSDALEISGGFEDVKLENFKHEGQNLIFTLTGRADGNFGGTSFSIGGDKLEKGLDVTFTTKVGRVPKAVQSSALYTNSTEPQTLRIFMDYDSFLDNINLKMLTFGGVMSDFEVIGFEFVDHKTVELTLTGGPSDPGTGTVRFDCAAILSGRTGRTAKIIVEDENAKEEEPSEEDDYESPMVGFFDKIFELVCSQALDYASSQIRDMNETNSFFGTLGLSDAEKQTQEMLREISGKIDKMSDQVAHNDKVLHQRLDKIDYSIGAASMKANLDTVDALYDNFKGRVDGNMSAGAFDEWCKSNLTYSTGNNNQAKKFINTLKQILKDLDIRENNGVLKTAPLFLKYEQTAKSGTPFEHNTFMVVTNYAMDWDAKIAGYMTLATTIVDYNRDKNNLSETVMENLMFDYNSLVSAVGTTFKNLENHINEQSYTSAHELLVVEGRPNKMFYVVSNQDGTPYVFADNQNSGYGPTFSWESMESPGARTSHGFVSRQKNLGIYWYHHLHVVSGVRINGVDPTPINGKSFMVEWAAEASTIKPPKTIDTFMKNMALIAQPQKMSLNTLLKTYLVSFENFETQKIISHWGFNASWIYSARVTYRKNGSAYYNDRTLMIDAKNVVGSNGLVAHSVTCEDGLYKNKQAVGKNEEIFILMIAY
jgi:hypothetical protein